MYYQYLLFSAFLIILPRIPSQPGSGHHQIFKWNTSVSSNLYMAVSTEQVPILVLVDTSLVFETDDLSSLLRHFFHTDVSVLPLSISLLPIVFHLPKLYMLKCPGAQQSNMFFSITTSLVLSFSLKLKNHLA